MKSGRVRLAVCALIAAHGVQAATWYVSTNGTDAAAGTNWLTAKQTIQAAIDLSASNDLVLVSNGVYATGGRGVYGSSVTNRIAITNAITVQSVNGPAVTTIVGAWDPVTTNGDAAVRCVYLGTNSTLAGFTLTNGATGAGGGGAWCATNAVVSNCVLAGNVAVFGGGVIGGILYGCTLSANIGTVLGGGACSSRLSRCVISGNSAIIGGGVGNSRLDNCLLTGNRAISSGGGCAGGSLTNCTVIGNSASNQAGGAYGGTIANCVVYYNRARLLANLAPGTVAYSCTTPHPGGIGNITNAPLIASVGNPHLLAGSPCIDSGANQYAAVSGGDLDGEPRIRNDTVDMGCDEFTPPLTGPLAVQISAPLTSAVSGLSVFFEAMVEGIPDALAWSWGDGGATTNLCVASHAFPTAGVYAVVLRASNAGGEKAATVTVQVAEQPVLYVAPGGGHVSPFANWADAATNIQAAIDEAPSGALLWVSNGVYATGGRLATSTAGTLATTNRVAVTNSIWLRSVNGPAVTVIDGFWDPAVTNGNQSVRCVFVGTNSTLAGFTLRQGATVNYGDEYRDQSGGGVWCDAGARVSNCVITGNTAFARGGGSSGGELRDCVLSDNRAGYHGGGSFRGTLTQCALTRNAATYGGGACTGALNDCVLSDNRAAYGGGTLDANLNSCLVVSNTAGWGGGCYSGVVHNCTLQGNTASNTGGGAAYSVLYDCIVTGNVAIAGAGLSLATASRSLLVGNIAATNGGGALSSTLTNCVLCGNATPVDGGGGANVTAVNCVLFGNDARRWGGGSIYSTLINCTVAYNSASNAGAGVYGGTQINSIVHFNMGQTGVFNYLICTMRYCSTAPARTGTGNITNEPLFVATNDYHLAGGSHCIDAGNSTYASQGGDLDGLPRVRFGGVDMGAFEFQTPLGYWLWAEAITNGQTGYGESAAGDDHPNLLRYATGASATGLAAEADLAAVLTTNQGVAVQFRRNTNAVDVTFIVEAAASLLDAPAWAALATNRFGSWGGATNVDEQSTNAAAATVQVWSPEATGTNAIMRLRVTRP